MTQTLAPRIECLACYEATLEDRTIGYISVHRMSGLEDLTDDDRGEIEYEVTRLLEEDRGTACRSHYDDTEW